MRALAGLLLSLVLVPSAAALPGDPPIELRSPAVGASVPVDPAGTEVSYTCPVYRSADYGDGTGIINGEDAYTALLADSPELDGDGRLLHTVDRATGASRPEDPNLCFVRLGDGGLAAGTYYWQASRICSQCSPQFEVSEVRSFTLVPATPPTLRLPARVYAGFPFIAALQGVTLPTGTAVSIERKVGSGWKEAGATSTPADATVVLPKGKQTLRARTATLTSAPRTVTVRPGSAKPTKVRGGRWKGRSATAFRVTGRTLRGFSTRVTLLCPTPGMVNPFTIQVATAAVRSVRLAPDGSFVGVSTANGSVRVRGRVTGSRLRGGQVEMSLGACTGSARLSAKPA